MAPLQEMLQQDHELTVQLASLLAPHAVDLLHQIVPVELVGAAATKGVGLRLGPGEES
jgi:hypothetical protein